MIVQATPAIVTCTAERLQGQRSLRSQQSSQESISGLGMQEALCNRENINPDQRLVTEYKSDSALSECKKKKREIKRKVKTTTFCTRYTLAHSHYSSNFHHIITHQAVIMATEPAHIAKIQLLEGIEDYPRWAKRAKGELQAHDCGEAIVDPSERDPVNRETITQYLRSLGYAGRNISDSVTIGWIEKHTREQKQRDTKAIGILKRQVADGNQHLIEGLTAHEIWRTLEREFKDVSPMSQLEVLRKACFIRMSDFSDPKLYCRAFETTLDQVAGMLQPDSIINQKGAEAMLLTCMLANVTDTYKPLIAQLRERWTPTNTSLSKACLAISRYDFATKERSSEANKAMLTTTKNPNRAPKGTCDFEDCVKAGLTTHWKDKCWKKHPDLRPKFRLNRMKTKNTKPNTSEPKAEVLTPVPVPPDITS